MGSMRGALLVGALVAVGVLVWVVTLDRAPDLGTDAATLRGEAEASLTGSANGSGPALQGTGTAAGDEALKGTIPAPAPVDPSTLDPVRDIFGIVVDVQGEPVAGATVAASEYTWRSGLITASGYYEAMQFAEARTATDGSFRLRIRPGQVVAVLVQHAGYAATEVQSVSGGARLRVVLRPGVRLVLTLEAPDGDAAADVAVGIWRADREGGSTSFHRSQSTGPDGRVVFEGLPGGVAAYLEPEPVHEGWGRPSWVAINLQESGEQHYTYRLPEGRTLRGLVTDAATGAPIEGARVGMNWVLDGEVKTDGDGHYVLPGWTGGGVRDIQVIAKGYVRGTAAVADRSEIDFQLQHGFSMRGRVVDDAGEPIQHARVATVGSEHRGSEQAISLGQAMTGPEGTFEIAGLDPTLAHTIQARALEYASVMLDVDAVRADETLDVGHIVLPRPATIEGRVIDAEGRPYERASVTLSSTSAGRSSRRTEGALAQRSYEGERELRTDMLGRFRAADLAPGTWTVTASAPGADSVTREVEAPMSESAPPLELVLGRSRKVMVTVLDPDGQPVPGFYVQDATRSSGGRTNEQGQIEISLPIDKATTLSAWPWGRRDLRAQPKVDVDASATEVTIRVERTVLVKGTLKDEEGHPLTDAVLYAFRGDEQVAMGTVGDSGEFRIDVQDPGEVEIRWSGDYVMRGPGIPDRPLMSAEPTRAVPGREVHLVAHVVPTDRRLRVEVVDPEGKPLVANVVVSGGMKILANRQADAHGVVVLEGLPSAEVYVSAQLPAGIVDPWLMPESVKIVPDGQTVTLAFRMGSWLDVTLREKGAPLGAKRAVQLSNGGGGAKATWHHGAVTDADGHFRVAVDPAWGNSVLLNIAPPDPGGGSWISRRVDAAAGRVEVSLDD